MDQYSRSWGGDNVRYESGHLGTSQFRLLTNQVRRQTYAGRAVNLSGFAQIGDYKEVMTLPEDVYSVLVGVRGETTSTTESSLHLQDSGALVVTSYLDGMIVPKYDPTGLDAPDGSGRTPAEVWEHRLNVWAHLHTPTVCGIKRATDTHLGGAKNNQIGGKSVTAIISGDTSIQNTTGAEVKQMDLLHVDMVKYIKTNYGISPATGGPVAGPEYGEIVTAPITVCKPWLPSFRDAETTTKDAAGRRLDLWQSQPFARAIMCSRAHEKIHIILLNNIDI
jgi:hypothetical protein